MWPAPIGLSVVAAWAGNAWHRPLGGLRHRQALRPICNFLDDYKAEAGDAYHPPVLLDPDAKHFIGEVNELHMAELRQVATIKGTNDGVDWGLEELASVEVQAVDDGGLLLQEVLCSASDQRCIHVRVNIPWPPNMPVRRLSEMRVAFTEISRRAFAAALSENTLPPEYQVQQTKLSGLMSLMNAQFGKLLRFYALKHAALSPTELVEEATVTQLTFEGLSLELTTLDVGGYSLEFGETVMRQTWSTSILFANRCQSADEVEDMLVMMIDRTAAAVEEGRLNVDGVAPEPISEKITNAERVQEQGDARTASLGTRFKRLRRAVRARRAAASNRATARYVAASRQWSWTCPSSAGD